jgi:large subunit ribosomal protein L24
MQRIRKDDQVVVIAGKNKGKRGRVIRVYPKQNKVLVEGVNVQTKHRRLQRTRAGGTEGGIVHEEAPIDASNVMPLDGNKPTRVGFVEKNGAKTRIARKSGEEL